MRILMCIREFGGDISADAPCFQIIVSHCSALLGFASLLLEPTDLNSKGGMSHLFFGVFPDPVCWETGKFRGRLAWLAVKQQRLPLKVNQPKQSAKAYNNSGFQMRRSQQQKQQENNMQAPTAASQSRVGFRVLDLTRKKVCRWAQR